MPAKQWARVNKMRAVLHRLAEFEQVMEDAESAKEGASADEPRSAFHDKDDGNGALRKLLDHMVIRTELGETVEERQAFHIAAERAGERQRANAGLRKLITGVSFMQRASGRLSEGDLARKPANGAGSALSRVDA